MGSIVGWIVWSDIVPLHAKQFRDCSLHWNAIIPFPGKYSYFFSKTLRHWLNFEIKLDALKHLVNLLRKSNSWKASKFNFTMPDDTLDLVMMDLMRRLGQIHHSTNFTSRSGGENRSTWKRKRGNIQRTFCLSRKNGDCALILNWLNKI